MNILDIFYENIVPEAMTGRINCLTYYNIAFTTKIIEENKEYCCEMNNDNLLIPSLIIKNKKEFDNLLIQYVDLAMKFYDDNNFEEEILNYKIYDKEKKICKEKVILSLLFANATVEDFENPIEFLKKRINFIYNDLSGIYNLGYCDIFKGNVNITIDKDIINNETPYQMIIKVISDFGDEFVFPKIKFGVSDDNIYIYAIQNKKNIDNAFCKKMNRTLYKVGEGYSENIGSDIESLKDITSSFLVSLNMAISFLHNKGFNKIMVPSILIARWNAKNISNLVKIRRKNLNNFEADEIMLKQDYLQQNLTNKLIRTFLRLGCHYNNIDILSFPYEIDSYLHISINDSLLQCNNSLLYATYKLVEHGISMNNFNK